MGKFAGPPRDRVWEFVVAISLVSLCLSTSLGVVYSVSFYQDSHGMVIPLQSAAQSFVLFACILSTFYLLAHTGAAIRGSKIYEDVPRDVRWAEQEKIRIAEKGNPFLHILHAWARLLVLLTLIAWLSAMAFVTTLFVHRTNAAVVAELLAESSAPEELVPVPEDIADAEKAMYYLRFDMAACAVGIAGSWVLAMVLWFAPRPYGVRFWKKYKEEVEWESSVSVGGARSKRCSSTTDAGSVMSGETAVAPASAGGEEGDEKGGDEKKGGAGGDDTCKESKLKDGGSEKPEPARAQPPRQLNVPGHFPGEA